MRSPIPGMDLYLESHWLDVHHGMTTYCRDQLQGKLPGSLRARVEERVFVEAEEACIQIIDHAAGGRVVTVIEFVSPTNKTRGDVALELQPLVDQLRNGAFDDIDYREVPSARFSSHEAARADPLLRAAGVR